MSTLMAAIVGNVLEREFRNPGLAELWVMPDGYAVGWPIGEVGPVAFLATRANLEANLRRLGMAAGLAAAE